MQPTRPSSQNVSTNNILLHFFKGSCLSFRIWGWQRSTFLANNFIYEPPLLTYMIACSPGQMLSLWKPLRKEQEAGVLQKPIIAYGKRAPWMVGARLQGGKWTTANPGARIPLCPQLLGPVECQPPPELLPLGTCATGMWGLAACRELILGHIRGDAQHFTHESFALQEQTINQVWATSSKWPHSFWPCSASLVL